MGDQQKSLDYFFPPQRMAQVAPTTPLAQLPIAPIPPELFSPGPEGDYNALEGAVDAFVQSSKMGKGQRFLVPHPGEPKTYEYLGPDSGGRKDWRIIRKLQPDLTS